ncbi:MAG: sugar nucleotide-binding protein [Chlamydiales bacterium]|nr:sugar nucleotide-binding protein [Chlamydiales bacterium]
MPPKTAIFGKGGLIGSHLFDYYQSFYPDLLGTDRTAFDLRNPQLSFSLEGYKWAIIAAGFATPQRCLSNPDLVEAIDVRGMRTVVHALQKRDVTPILFSTAYVYDGKEECYYPDTPTTPLNAYGQLHADREKELGGCLFLRLGRVYGEDERSIIGSIAAQLIRGEVVRAAVDQELQLVHVEDVVSNAITFCITRGKRNSPPLPEGGVSSYELVFILQSV